MGRNRRWIPAFCGYEIWASRWRNVASTAAGLSRVEELRSLDKEPPSSGSALAAAAQAETNRNENPIRAAGRSVAAPVRPDQDDDEREDDGDPRLRPRRGSSDPVVLIAPPRRFHSSLGALIRPRSGSAIRTGHFSVIPAAAFIRQPHPGVSANALAPSTTSSRFKLAASSANSSGACALPAHLEGCCEPGGRA